MAEPVALGEPVVGGGLHGLAVRRLGDLGSDGLDGPGEPGMSGDSAVDPLLGEHRGEAGDEVRPLVRRDVGVGVEEGRQGPGLLGGVAGEDDRRLGGGRTDRSEEGVEGVAGEGDGDEQQVRCGAGPEPLEHVHGPVGDHDVEGGLEPLDVAACWRCGRDVQHRSVGGHTSIL